jgi:hypothetical protein
MSLSLFDRANDLLLEAEPAAPPQTHADYSGMSCLTVACWSTPTVIRQRKRN